jgi:phosphotransferase system enzyme I (PtsP)
MSAPSIGAFEEALEGVRDEVDRMLEAHDMQSASSARSSRPSACSPTIAAGSSGCARAIASGLTAEAGVQRAFDDVRTRLGQSTDPYIRERLSDLQDLTNRLLLRLTGRAALDPPRCPRT